MCTASQLFILYCTIIPSVVASFSWAQLSTTPSPLELTHQTLKDYPYVITKKPNLQLLQFSAIIETWLSAEGTTFASLLDASCLLSHTRTPGYWGIVSILQQ